MQRDCDDGALDCSGAHKLLIVDSGFYTTPLFFERGYPAKRRLRGLGHAHPLDPNFCRAAAGRRGRVAGLRESEYPTTELLDPATEGLAFDDNGEPSEQRTGRAARPPWRMRGSESREATPSTC